MTEGKPAEERDARKATLFERDEVEQAVRIHGKAYRLLRWMEEAFSHGIIAPEDAGQYVSTQEATFGWIEKHLPRFPEDAQPDQRELREFSNYFSTYLANTFDIDAEPGGKRFSPNEHCSCPICSWMVRAPHVKAKKVTGGARMRAQNLKNDVLDRIADSHGGNLSADARHRIAQEEPLTDALNLCAYAVDLLERMKGFAQGPATLALWRSIAWTPQGSPKKGFELSVDEIMNAQDQVVSRVRAAC